MFSVTVFIDAGFTIQVGFHAVLAAVRFIGNNNDIAASIENRMGVFPFFRGEFLHGGKDNAASIASCKQITQCFTVICLYRHLLEQLLCLAECTIKLAVQIVTIGHNNNRRVAHLRLLQQFADIATHGDAFTGTLRMPDHACFLTAWLNITVQYQLLTGRSNDRRLHSLTHRVELVITSYFLN